MENLDFVLICVISFAVVFLILSVLSISIRLITFIFPEKSDDDDPAVIAAITTHLSKVYPHSLTTKIEEQK